MPPSGSYRRLCHQPLVLSGVLKSLEVRNKQKEVISQGMYPYWEYWSLGTFLSWLPSHSEMNSLFHYVYKPWYLCHKSPKHQGLEAIA